MAEELPKVEITHGAKPTHNPLQGYYRQPKLYIKLPSQGKFYPEGALDVSENGDYAIYAMTAKDELLMKTPDALLSGQGTVEVMQSCMPSLKNAWQMPTIDVDAVLMAIRIASYGETMDVTVDCPECKETNKYGIELTQYLNKAQASEYITEVQIDQLTIHLQPYSYKMLTETNIKSLEQQRIYNIVNDEKMSDQEKIEKFGKSFVTLTEMTVGTVANCINKVVTPEGSVEDKAMIKDFINNASREIFNKIVNTLEVYKERASLPNQNVKCEKCNHEWTMPVTMDQANFFADRS